MSAMPENPFETGRIKMVDPSANGVVYTNVYDARGLGDGSDRAYIGLGIEHEGQHIYVHLLETEAQSLVNLLLESLAIAQNLPEEVLPS